MTIRLTCTKCGSHLKIKDDLAGKQGHCPKCKADLLIPALVTAQADEAGDSSVDDRPSSDSLLHAPEADESPAVAPHEPARDDDDVADDTTDDSIACRDTVTGIAPLEETKVSPPLSLEPDEDLDEAPTMVRAPQTKSKSKSAPFDPADFLMEDNPQSGKKPTPRDSRPNRPNLDLLEKQMASRPAEADTRATPTPPTRSSAAAADAWDHAKAAKQMMKAIKQSNSEELRTHDAKEGESFDYVGAFRELGVKGLGGIALVLVAAVGLYYLSSSVMGGGPDLPPVGYVTGTVKLDGKPLEGATVYFAPHSVDAADVKRVQLRASVGVTDANGQYKMYYIDKHQGVAIGQCRVWLTKMGPQGRDLIPGSYAEASLQMREIKDGSQTFDFDLTTQP